MVMESVVGLLDHPTVWIRALVLEVLRAFLTSAPFLLYEFSPLLSPPLCLTSRPPIY